MGQNIHRQPMAQVILVIADRNLPTKLAPPTTYFRYCFGNAYRNSDTTDKSSASSAVIDCGHEHKHNRLRHIQIASRT